MTVLNFPASPGTGATYEENGVIYTWNGSYWSANNATDLSSVYVAVAGDRMTGHLELPGGGGDTAALQKQEIELLIDAGGGGGSGPTDLYWERDAGELSPKVSTDNVVIGDDAITLNANGNIGANDEIVSSKDGTNIAKLNSAGYVSGQRVNADANAAVMLARGALVGPPVDMWGVYTDGSLKIGGTLPSAPNITLNADGIASFAGDVTSSRSASEYTKLLNTGNLNISVADSAVAGTEVIQVTKNPSNTPLVKVKADGSAEFAGPVSVGGMDDAHTIDEYEEGSWTPIWTGNGAQIGTGSYIKVGKVCTCFASITFPGTNATETQILGGLPFHSTGNQTFGGYSYLVGTTKYPGFTFVYGSSQYFSVRSSNAQNVDLLRNDVAGIPTNIVLQYEVA